MRQIVYVTKNFLYGFLATSSAVSLFYLGFQIKKKYSENRFNLKALYSNGKEGILNNARDILIGGLFGGTCHSFRETIKNKNFFINGILFQLKTNTDNFNNELQIQSEKKKKK